MILVFIWFITISSFLLGYLVGRRTNVPEAIGRAGKNIKDRLNPPKLGAIQKQTPEEYNRHKSKRMLESEEAMENTLDEIMEKDEY